VWVGLFFCFEVVFSGFCGWEVWCFCLGGCFLVGFWVLFFGLVLLFFFFFGLLWCVGGGCVFFFFFFFLFFFSCLVCVLLVCGFGVFFGLGFWWVFVFFSTSCPGSVAPIWDPLFAGHVASSAGRYFRPLSSVSVFSKDQIGFGVSSLCSSRPAGRPHYFLTRLASSEVHKARLVEDCGLFLDPAMGPSCGGFFLCNSVSRRFLLVMLRQLFFSPPSSFSSGTLGTPRPDPGPVFRHFD